MKGKGNCRISEQNKNPPPSLSLPRRVRPLEPREPHSGRPAHGGEPLPLGGAHRLRRPLPLRRVAPHRGLRPDGRALRPQAEEVQDQDNPRGPRPDDDRGGAREDEGGGGHPEAPELRRGDLQPRHCAAEAEEGGGVHEEYQADLSDER